MTPISIPLPKLGIINLQSGCLAESQDATLRTSQEFTEKTNISIFETFNLNLTTFINKTDIKYLHNIYRIINDTTSQTHLKSTSLQSGSDLKDIIEKAKKLTEYEELVGKFDTHSHSTLLILIATLAIILVLILGFLGAYCLGGLKTNLSRLISDNTSTGHSNSTINSPIITEEIITQPQLVKPTPQITRNPIIIIPSEQLI